MNGYGFKNYKTSNPLSFNYITFQTSECFLLSGVRQRIVQNDIALIYPDEGSEETICRGRVDGKDDRCWNGN
jgi:hypothetical protein